jgi:fatty-acyl-CoA synthase
MMEYPLTLDRIVEHANRLFPAKRVVTRRADGSVHVCTYADVYRRSKRLANALVGLGVEPGDRVGTFAWNNHQHLEMYFGIPGAGAVCHTLNIRLSPDQLAYIANHAEDRVVVVDGSLLPLFEKVAGDLDSVEHFVLYNVDRDIETSLPRVSHYEDLLEAADESMFLHTLGENQAMALGLTESDVVLPVVPQFHAMGWGLPYACAMTGAEIVLPGPHLKPDAIADMIVEHRVTVAAGVPSIWNGLHHELADRPRDLSSLRLLIAGGSAMPRSLIEAFEDQLDISVLHSWGMTEMSPVGTISRLLTPHADRTRSEQWDAKARQGYPIAGVEIRITDDEGQPLPWDGTTMGELQVRGPWVVRAYYRTEPTTEHFTDDGWFRTGDVATIDAHGCMAITDRTKDLVKSGGEWISSVALETALMAHDGVVEAAVVSIPDQQWSERPLAVIVRRADGDVTSDELRRFLEPSFAKFWIPESFAFVDTIPKTSVGKFDKKVLRRRHADGDL